MKKRRKKGKAVKADKGFLTLDAVFFLFSLEGGLSRGFVRPFFFQHGAEGAALLPYKKYDFGRLAWNA